jgi:hypothetical protein
VRAAGEARRSGYRRRTTTAVQVAAFVLGVALLAAGADALARAGAESLVARDVQQAVGTDERPEVSVRGAFFLPQVIRGSYGEVDVTTRDVTSGPLRLRRVASRLRDVRVPFHDVLVGDVRRLWIGRSDERASLTYDDLDHYLEVTGRSLQVAPRPGGEVLLTGTARVLGRSVDVSADVSLTASEGQLRISPRQSVTGAEGLDGASRLLLSQRLSFAVPLPLPFGQHLTRVRAREDAIDVRAQGTGVLLEP